MANCLTFHYDPLRSGSTIGPSGDATLVPTWTKYCTIPMKKPVRAAPLVIENWQIPTGPFSNQTHTLVFVASSANEVMAFAEDELIAGNTTPLWSQQLGTALNKHGSNIPVPVGIASTPVIDLDHQRLFVMALQDDGHGNGVYHIYALDINSGSILQNHTLHDAGAKGRPTFDSTLQDQRGALNIVGDRVYATFADFYANDKGAYHGWVVGCQVDNLSNQWFFSVTTTVLGGGVWGPGGVAAAEDNTLYIATGNSPSANAQYWAQFDAGGTHQNKHPGDIGDYFEGVVRLGPLPGEKGLQVLDWYIPNNARQLNDQDLDLGGSSPLLLSAIDGHELLVVTAKDKNIYLLNRQHLGHWGGEIERVPVFSNESKTTAAHFLTTKGQHYVYATSAGTPGVVAYKVEIKAGKPTLVEAWRSPIQFGDVAGAAVVVRTAEGSDNALVWVAGPKRGNVQEDVLLAFHALDGTVVFDSSKNASQNAPGSLPHFPPVTCAGKSVFVGTNAGVSCYGLPHQR